MYPFPCLASVSPFLCASVQGVWSHLGYISRGGMRAEGGLEGQLQVASAEGGNILDAGTQW